MNLFTFVKLFGLNIFTDKHSNRYRKKLNRRELLSQEGY